MSAENDPSSSWWYILGTILATLVGAVLKTFVDLVKRRDSFDEKWRTDLLADIQGLREWNGKQQEELNSLNDNLSEEQSIRLDLKSQLSSEKFLHQALRTEYNLLLLECEKLKEKVKQNA